MKVWQLISAFLAGVALSFALCFIMALKRINVTNADTVIESLEQSIKKLKQSGNDNLQDITPTVILPREAEVQEREELEGTVKKDRKPFLGIRLKKKEKQQNT